MREYKVIAQIEFTIYDTEDGLAERQANYGLAAFVNGNEEALANYQSEYPEAPKPHYIAGSYIIINDEEEVVVDRIGGGLDKKTEEEEPAEADSEDK